MLNLIHCKSKLSLLDGALHPAGIRCSRGLAGDVHNVSKLRWCCTDCRLMLAADIYHNMRYGVGLDLQRAMIRLLVAGSAVLQLERREHK